MAQLQKLKEDLDPWDIIMGYWERILGYVLKQSDNKRF